MCGIVGYIGSRSADDVLLSGLKRLEYRGYDSAGLALLDDHKIKTLKQVGKVKNLVKQDEESDIEGQIGIAHTRWATHGAPTQANTHPHTSKDVAIVHNGIIENYLQLKENLQGKGFEFKSETDSEVLAHLIQSYLDKGLELTEAVRQGLAEVEGTYGLVVLHKDNPKKLVAARRGSPLLIGVGDGEVFVASDATAVVAYTKQVAYLEDDDVATVTPEGYQVVDSQNKQRERLTQEVGISSEAIEKDGYDHFLLKEIMQQPETIKDVLRGRTHFDQATSHLGGLNLDDAAIKELDNLITIGCGTAYYAGLLGKYLIERLTGLTVNVDFASEFRYRDPNLGENSAAVIISQSGETADTLASLQEIKQKSIHTLGLVNVVGSTIAREVDGGIYLHAGPEISVASTKAFTAQVVAQILLGLDIGRQQQTSYTQGITVLKALESLPEAVGQTLELDQKIKKVVSDYKDYDRAMYLGRDTLYPVALEGALKLKEISYIQAEAHPAGEMKHGPIALIDDDIFVVYLIPENNLYSKAFSNLQELNSRGAHILAVTTEGNDEVENYVDHVLHIPEVSPWVEPLVANIPLQLFAYHMAVARGTDVDKPRNLAKSVTVE